jgi:hypothetical protein
MDHFKKLEETLKKLLLQAAYWQEEGSSDEQYFQKGIKYAVAEILKAVDPKNA